jgi:hypothetical protein
MSKNNKITNYPDPKFFQQVFAPLVQEWIDKKGGLENALKHNPLLAQFTLSALSDSKEEAVNWLANNFSFSQSALNTSFNKIEQACNPNSTDLAGDMANKEEVID